MFSSLADAYQRRSQQQALDVLRASSVYEQIRKDNPQMLQQSQFVDFSNPESVNMILNPYGTYQPNPNAMQQNTGYNPYSYLPSSYTTGTWYGTPYGFNTWGLADTARFMIASQEDIDAGRLTTATVVQVSKEEEKPQQIQDTDSTQGFADKLIKGLEKLQVKIVQVTKEIKKKERPKYIVVKNNKPHLDHTGYDNDELDVNKQEMKLIPESPLDWTESDENDLSNIADQLAIYDKAMAHTIWNIPTLDGLTREDWQYFRRCAIDILQDYRDKERMNPNVDYRAPYRYRQLPAVYTDSDGNIMPDMNVPVPLVYKIVNINGEATYTYDRCRDTLTEAEWDVFLDRAYAELLSRAKKLQYEDIVNLNRGILETKNEQKPQNNLPPLNPNDPISVKLWQMKYTENQYNNHKEFYRNIFRSKMTDEQFDNWWYGTSTSRQPQTQAEANRNWAMQMTELSVQELSKVIPYDPVQLSQYYNNMALSAINAFTQGTMKKDMSAKEVWDNLGYLSSRIHEMNLEEQKKAQAQAYYQNMSHDTFRKSLYQFMNTPTANNPNPNYTSQYGTVDPRFGLPSTYVDITNTPEMQARRNQFLEYCNSTTGQAPLSPIFR